MAGTALVTGASGGIGAGIVEVLSAAGVVVHAAARRAERLNELSARTGCIPHTIDLTDGAAVARLAEEIEPDVLVNNAGRGGGFSGLAEASREEITATIGTNVVATLDLLRVFLPGMIGRQRGHIVNIGSVAALYPSASATYGGSKAAVRLISQNLRLELRGTGIRVTEIRPGRVTSEFYDVAVPDPAVAAVAKNTGIRELSPRDVGDAVLYAIRAPRHVNVSTIEIQPLEQTYGGAAFDPVFR